MRITSVTLLAAALFAAAPAHASIYSTTFSGAVTRQSGAGPAVGSTVSGAFAYSSDANRFLSFTIAGIAAAPPFTSTVTTSPASVVNPYEAIYAASTSIAGGTGATNAGFTLDLLAFDTFASPDALAILAAPGLGTLLETQANSFDGNFSTFSYYSGTATAVTRSFTVALNAASLSTQVPEPASLALLATPVLGLAFRRRR